MKMLISILAIFGAVSFSHAEVKPDGYVFTERCGDTFAQNIEPRLERICIASIVNGSPLTGKSDKVIVAYGHGELTVATVHKITGERTMPSGRIEVILEQIGIADAKGIFQPMTATLPVLSRVQKTVSTGGLVQKMEGNIAGEAFETDEFQTIFHTM